MRHQQYGMFALVSQTSFRGETSGSIARFRLFSQAKATAISYRAFSHDVTVAILVFQNNETAAMLVYQENPLGVELFSHVNAFFCSNKLA